MELIGLEIAEILGIPEVVGVPNLARSQFERWKFRVLPGHQEELDKTKIISSV